MSDREVLLRKLSSIGEHVDRMRRRRSVDLASFRGDVDRQDALAMSLLVAVQDALDIALHLAASAEWGVPASYAEAFDLLRTHDLIDAGLAQELQSMAALRNRVAHGYASVDAERIWNELPAGLNALGRFAAAIAAHLGEP